MSPIAACLGALRQHASERRPLRHAIDKRQDESGNSMRTITARQAAHPRPTKTFPLLLLVSLLCSAWLLSTQLVPSGVVDLLDEIWYVAWLLLAVPAFAGTCLLALDHAAWGLARRQLLAAWPLGINALALGVFLLAPVSRPLDLLDFQLHHAPRAEVVRQLEAGELLTPWPWTNGTLVPLVGYPRSLSQSAGHRMLVRFHADGALHVVIHHVTGLRREHSAFVYRSDGRPPTLPSRYLPYTGWSEPLTDRWYRVVLEEMCLPTCLRSDW